MYVYVYKHMGMQPREGVAGIQFQHLASSLSGCSMKLRIVGIHWGSKGIPEASFHSLRRLSIQVLVPYTLNPEPYISPICHIRPCLIYTYIHIPLSPI